MNDAAPAAEARAQSWRRLLAAIAALAIGLASVGGAVLWALDEMRDANQRADRAQSRAQAVQERAQINSARIDQLEAFVRSQGIEPPPPVTTTSTTAPRRRSTATTTPRRATTTTTAPRPASTTTQPPAPTTGPPPTTTTTARPCNVTIPGVCLP